LLLERYGDCVHAAPMGTPVQACAAQRNDVIEDVAAVAASSTVRVRCALGRPLHDRCRRRTRVAPAEASQGRVGACA
jgi:hypothetical protein